MVKGPFIGWKSEGLLLPLMGVDTPVDLAASLQQNTTVYENSQAFADKLPDYFRIDFGTYFKRDRPTYSWTLAFDCQNIINRMNVEDQVFDPSSQTVIIERNLGIVPVMSWKVQFGVKGKKMRATKVEN